MPGSKQHRVDVDQGGRRAGVDHGGSRRPRSVVRFGVAAPRVSAAVALVVAVVNWRVLLFEPGQMRMLTIVLLGLTAAVTVHELGHFVAGTSRGLDLYVRVGPGFGWCAPIPGSATQVELSPLDRVVFAAAGPLANLTVYVLLGIPPVAARVASVAGGSLLGEVVEVTRLVSLPIGLFNLLPLGVLDGGRIVLAAFDLLPVNSRVVALRSFQAFTLVACVVVVRACWESNLPAWWMLVDTVVFALIGVATLAQESSGLTSPRRQRTPAAAGTGALRSLGAGLVPFVASVGAGILFGSLVANQLFRP